MYFLFSLILAPSRRIKLAAHQQTTLRMTLLSMCGTIDLDQCGDHPADRMVFPDIL